MPSCEVLLSVEMRTPRANLSRGDPTFDPGLTSVLFFSRGRGRGHVVPDVAIFEELRRLRSDVDLRFVSYATGAETLEELGHGCIDLELPEANPLIETLVRCARLVGWLKPCLVVVHEEFPALPAAKIFGLPVVFLTDWFAEAKEFTMHLMAYADEIIFLDKPGIFGEPAHLKGKIHYTAPVFRSFSYCKEDCGLARQELGLRQDAVVISVLPGSWTEKQTPIYDLVVAAFDCVSGPHKTLLWVAGSDYELLKERTKNRYDVIIMEKDWQIDRLFVASNLAITKANRMTNLELAALGIPSISLSYSLNRPDDIRVAQIATNIALDARTLDSLALAESMEKVLAGNTPTEAPGLTSNLGGRRLVAERLSFHINRIRQERQG